MPTPSESAWLRPSALLADRFPALAADLNPPASSADLAALADRVGADSTEALTPLFGARDGQRNEAAGLFFGLQFLSAAEAVNEWGRWMSVLADDPALATDIKVSSLPEGAVKPTYYDAGWIPFAIDGAGNGFAVDLDPGPNGTVGQVISFGVDESLRRVLAPSAEAFLQWFAEAIESGLASVSDDAAAPGGKCLRLAGASHPLDVADQVFGSGPPTA